MSPWTRRHRRLRNVPSTPRDHVNIVSPYYHRLHVHHTDIIGLECLRLPRLSPPTRSRLGVGIIVAECTVVGTNVTRRPPARRRRMIQICSHRLRRQTRTIFQKRHIFRIRRVHLLLLLWLKDTFSLILTLLHPLQWLMHRQWFCNAIVQERVLSRVPPVTQLSGFSNVVQGRYHFGAQETGRYSYHLGWPWLLLQIRLTCTIFSARFARKWGKIHSIVKIIQVTPITT